MNNFRFFIPTELFYGAGSLEKLATEPLPGKRALVVTGGNSIKRLGILERVLSILQSCSVETVLYDGVTPNPVKEIVAEAAQLARNENCDFVVGLGGGSSIDAAKAIAMMAANSGDIWDYIQVGSGGKKPFSKPGLPLIAIPTTAGTGTEGNPTAVITNADTGEKVGMSCAFPVKSFVDPELTLNISPSYTAFQGFDALFHSLEAFISVRATPVSDVWALESMRLIFAHLATAVNDGMNLEARDAVSRASMMAGMVICISSCTSAHLIEHSLSGIVQTLPHGEGLILISAAFHGLGAQHIPDRYALIADALGFTKPGQTILEKARSFLTVLEDLKAACGVSERRLSDHGFSEKDIDLIVRNAHVIAGGPFTRDRYVISDESLAEMIRASL